MFQPIKVRAGRLTEIIPWQRSRCCRVATHLPAESHSSALCVAWTRRCIKNITESMPNTNPEMRLGSQSQDRLWRKYTAISLFLN